MPKENDIKLKDKKSNLKLSNGNDYEKSSEFITISMK